MLRTIPLFFALFVSIAASAQVTPQHRAALDPSLRPFYHGVASGDPTEDHMMIWTRVTPDSGTTGDIEVFWQMATDTGYTNVVNYGKALATADNDYCVKVDVCGLQPSTFYYYMFRALGRNSISGRTKTAPGSNSDNDSVRLAVVSCADYENGYFNAYESISTKNNVDAVVHLGDYIYEYEPGGISISNPGNRVTEPDHEIITAEDYRIRHSHYKLDYQLKRLHQLFPFITVWDDHETANNSWRDGAENHTPGTEGLYSDRKRAATSTYYKWMPLRLPDPLDTFRIFRNLRYGKLLDLIMIDTRLYDRDETDLGATNSPNHKLMGPVEMAWFLQQLNDTSTRWKIIGNQVMFAPLEIFGQPFNSDQWDGYNYERQQIQNNILQNNVQNVVVLTGDIHTAWCNDVPGSNYNSSTGAGSVCVEFVGTSVTSQNSPFPVPSGIIKSLNPHMKYINLDDHGYYILDVRKTRAQADFTFLSTTDQPTFTNNEGVSYFVNHTERFLRQGTPISNVPAISAVVPSLFPNQSLPFAKINDHYATVPENTQVQVNVIPNGTVCPAVNLTVLQGQHGGAVSLNGKDVTYVPQNNYYGFDTVGFVVCSSNPTACDTVYLYVEILQVDDIDTVNLTWTSPQQESICVSFDDLQTGTQSILYNTTSPLTLTTQNDSCYNVTVQNNFCGKAVVTFVATDSLNNHDTVVYIIKIGYYTQADVITVPLNKNTNTTQCFSFNDLFCPPTAIVKLKNPSNGTFQMQGDSCVKYFPYYNYVGTDTMIFTACDTCGPEHCDTVIMVFDVQQPTALPDEKRMVVFGMYPNPVGDKLIIQYYLFREENVEFKVFDVNGRLISEDNAYYPGTGLLYAQINTTPLAPGTYFVEIKAGGHVYRKQVLKQ